MSGADKGERSPEENQHRDHNQDSLGGDEPNDFPEFLQTHVDQHVVPPRLEVHAGRLTLLNQVSQPGIIGVAGNVPGFEPLVPEAGNQ